MADQSSVTILVVDDDALTRRIISEDLTALGYRTLEAEDGEDALRHLTAADILLTDLMMPRMDGLTLLGKAREIRPDLPVILITAHASVEAAVSAMQEGAADFVEKPFRPPELAVRIQRVADRLAVEKKLKRLERENEVLRQEFDQETADFEQMIGRSPVIRDIYAKIERIAPSNASVLVLGESGTGKELVARAIHRRSLRSQGPFVKMNCSVFNEGILESELFGHEKGAFTGATRTRLGRFELADAGTIFLDEIGDLSPLMQLKLLRVLQEREFERVGSAEVIRVDVRVISATNKNLEEAVRSRQFREDLYFRLNVVTLELPPLRERGDDIELLINHFIERYGRELNRTKAVSAEAMALLKGHAWPGNIRELENVVQTALLLSTGDVVEEWDLPAALKRGAAQGQAVGSGGSLKVRLWEYERENIHAAYAQNQGNITQTARALGLERNCLKYKLKKFGIRGSHAAN